MRSVFRFSFAGFASVTITAATFLMMLALLRTPDSLQGSEPLDINFSINRTFEPIKQTVRPQTPKPPELKKAKQPPKTLNIEIAAEEIPLDLNMPAANGVELGTAKGIPGYGIGSGDFPMVPDSGGTLHYGVPPAYPRKPLIAGIEGWVDVKMKVNESGLVIGVEVLDSYPKGHFERAAQLGVKKWKFHPKIVNGQAVPFTAKQRVEFTINKE